MAEVMGEALIKIRTDATEAIRDAAKAGKQIAQEVGATVSKDQGGKFASGLGKMAGKGVDLLGKTLKRGAIGVGAAAGGVLGTALFQGFGRLRQIDEAEFKLRGLGHTTDGVKQIMDNALASVKGTSFGLGEAASVAATMVASGIKPGQDLEKTLGVLASTAAVANTSMTDMSGVFDAAAATGRVTGATIWQLSRRGIPAVQMLAKETGVSTEEMRKRISAGQVSFEEFVNVMDRQIGPAAKEMGNSFTGMASNVQAAMSRFGAAFLQGAFSRAKPVLQAVMDAFDAMTPVAQRWGDRLGAAIDSVGQWIQRNKPAIKAFGDALLDMARTAGSWVVDRLKDIGNVLRDFGGWLSDNRKPIMDFASALGRELVRAADIAWQALGKIGDWFRNNQGIIKTIATVVGTTLVGAFKTVNTVLETALSVWDKIPRPLQNMAIFGGAAAIGMKQLVGPIQNVVSSLTPFAKGAQGVVTDVMSMRGEMGLFQSLSLSMQTNPATEGIRNLGSQAKFAAGAAGLGALIGGLAQAKTEGINFGSIMQGVAGGAGIGMMFGPVGALIGGAAGGGLTALMGAFGGAKDSASNLRSELIKAEGFKASKDAADDLTKALIGQKDAYTEVYKESVKNNLMIDESSGKYNKWVQDLVKAGVGADTIRDALAGSTEAQKVMTGAIATGTREAGDNYDDIQRRIKGIEDGSIQVGAVWQSNRWISGPQAAALEIQRLKDQLPKAEEEKARWGAIGDAASGAMGISKTAMQGQEDAMARLANQIGITVDRYKMWPTEVRTLFEMEKLPQTTEQFEKLLGEMALTPAQIISMVKLNGVDETFNGLKKIVDAAPPMNERQIELLVQAAGVDLTDRQLNRLKTLAQETGNTDASPKSGQVKGGEQTKNDLDNIKQKADRNANTDATVKSGPVKGGGQTKADLDDTERRAKRNAATDASPKSGEVKGGGQTKADLDTIKSKADKAAGTDATVGVGTKGAVQAKKDIDNVGKAKDNIGRKPGQVNVNANTRPAQRAVNQLQNQIQRLGRGRTSITIAVDGRQATRGIAQISAQVTRVTRGRHQIRVAADTGPASRSISGLGQQVTRMVRARYQMRPTVDTGAASRSVNGLYQQITRMVRGRYDAKVTVTTSAATSSINSVKAQLNALDRMTASPSVSVSTSGAMASINSVRNALNTLPNPTQTITVRRQNVGGAAAGVTNFSGGWLLTGEHGPELMRVPRGADIYPAGATRRMLGTAPSGGATMSRDDARMIAEELADAIGTPKLVQVTVPTPDPAAAAMAVMNRLATR